VPQHNVTACFFTTRSRLSSLPSRNIDDIADMAIWYCWRQHHLNSAHRVDLHYWHVKVDAQGITSDWYLNFGRGCFPACGFTLRDGTFIVKWLRSVTVRATSHEFGRAARANTAMSAINHQMFLERKSMKLALSCCIKQHNWLVQPSFVNSLIQLYPQAGAIDFNFTNALLICFPM